jgi:dihydrofolate synthase/folylpolyglutamate synthase
MGLAQVKWPGRLQLITRPGGQRILLDGAHNIPGVETLVAALKKDFPAMKRTLILGMLADKDWRPMCELFAPLAERVILLPVESKRTASPEQLAGVFRVANPTAEVVCVENLTQALDEAARDEFVVVAGSLYLIGAVLSQLDPSMRDVGDERGLNEWSGAR